MNNGRYPDHVNNEAIDMMKKGVEPKDVVDVFLLRYGYRDLHPRTVARWSEKWPMGKLPKSLPSGFRKHVDESVRKQTSSGPMSDGFREEVRELVEEQTSHRRPANPVKEEADAMCRQENHDWMKSLEGIMRYQDQWFSEEVVPEPTEQQGILTLWHIKKCWGCGHQEEWSVTDSEIGFSIRGELPYPMANETSENEENQDEAERVIGDQIRSPRLSLLWAESARSEAALAA